MRSTSFTALSMLAATAAARKCINQTVSVCISARQPTFNIDVPQTNLEVTDFILNVTQQGRTFADIVQTGTHITSGTYNISTMFCSPDNGPTNPTLQILTHGIGFDKTYWDISYEDYKYSYINSALAAGYCTLSYDRLGIGKSSHGEPLNEIQSNIEIAALHALTTKLRNGSFPMVHHAFEKVVHVGHSFGSAQTYAFADYYPDLTDGIVLTGFSMDGDYVNLFSAGGCFVQANENQPKRFSSLPNGYFLSSDAESIEYLFLKPKFFDLKLLTEVLEPTKQPVTPGEMLSLTSLPPTNSYTGPILILTGDSDLPYCGSNCSAITNLKGFSTTPIDSLPGMVKNNFPNASKEVFEAYVQPNMGHGINVHYNATGAYDVIIGFLERMGL